MSRLIPCRESPPSLPVKPKRKTRPKKAYDKYQLFGFDTETTVDGKKELRSYQAAWIDKETDAVNGCVYFLDGYYQDGVTEDRHPVIVSQLASYGVKTGRIDYKGFPTVDDLRHACQVKHENLIYDGQARMKLDKKGVLVSSRRSVKRCAVAFNGNFDMGVLSDTTALIADMEMGGMEGAGVEFRFSSGVTRLTGMPVIKALYLGADNVPFVTKRGILWDIQPAAKHIWGAVGLAGVGDQIGLPKMTAKFDCPAYGFIDAAITLFGGIQLTYDLKSQGFQNAPDRFISGATVAKDVMAQHYEPFYLERWEHEQIWPAYMGGMTGGNRPSIMRKQVHNVVYGDLDGAYNVCGQNLNVFAWGGCRTVSELECKSIIKQVQSDPSQYWKYGSLHLVLEGDFDNCPVRVAEVGDFSEADPSTSHGLVWARMRGYATTLALGDYLHAKPKKVKIRYGYMRTLSDSPSPCLFKMAADNRARFPKKKYPIENTWWKLVGNCTYGSFANRNGKHRQDSGKWFNVLIASSITAGIRHMMHIVNETAGDECYYNDTDSGLGTERQLARCQKALKPVGIGFSNKTHDELKGVEVADFAIVQGSKRYCMVKGHKFGAKCHGLGSWYVGGDALRAAKATDKKYDSEPIAWNKSCLKAVWQFNYPDYLGEAPHDIQNLKVFHKFSIRCERTSILVQKYMLNQGVPLGETWRYGKAGNFGFLSPSIVDGKKVNIVSFSAEEAARLSNVTLAHVAFRWGRGYDKKFNYVKQDRWEWSGSDLRMVTPTANSQTLNAGQQDALEGSLSVHVAH